MTLAAAGLSVTQLEVTTYSFSVISMLIHLVQWAKLKDVEELYEFSHPKISHFEGLGSLESLASAYLK